MDLQFEVYTEKGHKYMVSVDWGVADQGDKTVMKIVDYTNPLDAEIVKHYQKQGGDPMELIAMLQFLSNPSNRLKG